MASLDRTLRKLLENKVKDARRVAQTGARQALEQLAVHHHEPWNPLTVEQRKLRNRLRAHGRQLGDQLDASKGTQTIERLEGACAYEHWHRLLFARFLAENDLLIEPESGMPLSLAECQELARDKGTDWLVLASEYAERMLPQIFRAGDPVLDVVLAPEKRQDLEAILEALPRDVFVADDSLGWVYQFWQAEEKDRVNKSEKKIGAEELPAVTQLFTEDYMVDFLLHNTLGAWHAGKLGPLVADSEAEARAMATLTARSGLPAVSWSYLRFVQDESTGTWFPASGTFPGWPAAAKDIKFLDPCMGSGHFLVFALPLLARLRMEEEGLAGPEALAAVLRDNLHGLELDPRCTQIAAFNVALAAWKLGGWQALPPLQLACSGLAPQAPLKDWLALAGDNENHRRGLEELYHLFAQAPVLGSLINPRQSGNLLVAGYDELAPLMERAMADEGSDEAAHELAITAQGIAKAATILSGQFTLVATNVPYLGRGKQTTSLVDYCDRFHPNGKHDLGSCLIERCLAFCQPCGSTGLVTPQNWLFLNVYKRLREQLLNRIQWNGIVRLGAGAFKTISGEVVKAALITLSRAAPDGGNSFFALETSLDKSPTDKADAMKSGSIRALNQAGQLANPDARITFQTVASGNILSKYCKSVLGLGTGDFFHYGRRFWELAHDPISWSYLQSSVDNNIEWGGREHVIAWDQRLGRIWGMTDDERTQIHNQDQSGRQAWGRLGIAVSLVGSLKSTIYSGELHEKSVAILLPESEDLLPALWCLCSSAEFPEMVRALDQKTVVANGAIVKVPFDQDYWRAVAGERYSEGLPKPFSSDPTQWLFTGRIRDSAALLQVAVARLLGYMWPRQAGASFWGCPRLGVDGLEAHADDDGIVPLNPLRGEAAAANRLQDLLAEAWGPEWSPNRLDLILSAAGSGSRPLDDWLRDGFFSQHCALFHQRPFIWHIWDGRRDGFNVLVNYHKLAAPEGEGRRTLEKLIYSYLGDWIDRQRVDQVAGIEGADARVAAAMHLKHELESILEGEPPYDIFVRWKPLRNQPIGWDPDINDGVRLNIRPFMSAKPLDARGKNACILRVMPRIKWDKDRGKEPTRPKEDYPWFWTWDEKSADFPGGPQFDGTRWNDLHYSRKAKLAARDGAKLEVPS